MQERYEKEKKILWVLRQEGPDDLIAADSIPEFVEALVHGSYQGQDVKEIRFVFADSEAAEYNLSSLAYLNIQTWTGDLEDARPLDGPAFSTEEDFGI